MMGRFILTGAPGAGKTAVVRQLEIDGFAVVEEAATDVIALEQAKGVAEPWTDAGFTDRIVALRGREGWRRPERSRSMTGPQFARKRWRRFLAIRSPTGCVLKSKS